MFDVNNPSIILCSRQLEQAIDMKALHVTEVTTQVLMQLEDLPDEELHKQDQFNYSPSRGRFLHSLYRPYQTEPPTAPRQRLMGDINPDHSFYTNKDRRFTLKPNFLKVIQTVLTQETRMQTSFSYEEVTRLLSNYILSNKERLFDQRNIRLAIVQDDQLGTAFGVRAFHRCQINNLIKSQLIPVTGSSQPQGDCTTLQDNSRSTRVPGPQINTGTQTLPQFISAFPTYRTRTNGPLAEIHNRGREYPTEVMGSRS